MDLVLLFKEGYVYVHYHLYPTFALCSESYDKTVVFPYDILPSNQSHISQIQGYNLSLPTTVNANLLFSDFNNDGYPDFIVDLINGTTQSLLMINNQCVDQNNCGIPTFNLPFLNTLTTSNLHFFSM